MLRWIFFTCILYSHGVVQISANIFFNAPSVVRGMHITEIMCSMLIQVFFGRIFLSSLVFNVEYGTKIDMSS